MRETNDTIGNLLELLGAANGEIESTQKLHSLVYLCEFAGTDLGQDFDFQYYRMYSQTLARDLDVAVVRGLINRLGESGKVSLVSRNARKAAKQKPDGLAVVEKLCNENENTLEVLSVLCYLHKVGYANDELASKLEDLKPELKSNFNKAYSLAASVFSIKPKMLAHS